MEFTIDRILAVLMAVALIIIAGIGGGGLAAYKMLAFVILPLGCIFFSEAVGEYTSFYPRNRLDSVKTPKSMVYIAGWILLLVPLLLWLISLLPHK